MSKVLMTSIFIKDPNIVCREIAGEMILVPIRNNVSDMANIYTLNETAAVIWQQIDGKQTLREINQVVLDQFDVGQNEAEKDLFELITNLTEVGALKKVNL